MKSGKRVHFLFFFKKVREQKMSWGTDKNSADKNSADKNSADKSPMHKIQGRQK